MASGNIESKVEKLLEDIIKNLGYELYDVRYEKEGKDYYLRIIIDKLEGININDCETVNNAINDILDEADYIKEQYFLEVSSPGLEVGILESFNETEGITLKVDDKVFKIDFKDIAIAKTIFNW